MKKFLSLILVMVCFLLPASAAEINLEEMDMPSLLKLHEKLDAKIQDGIECLINKNYIYQGEYVVGKDIKAGHYLATCVVDCRNDEDFDFFYELYESQETHAHFKRMMFDRFNVGESGAINLSDGMVFTIVNGTASLKLMDTPAWAP